jgi:hypothetical protein
MDTLGPELRRMVYAQCVKIRAFGLLYANKQYYNEFIPFLREEFVLAFHIDPSSSSTVVKIINSDNSPWGHACTFDAASLHADYSMVDTMPVDRFKEIRILIDAPDVNDPGQVIRGWLQSNGLTRALLPRWANPDSVPQTEADIFLPVARLTSRLPPLKIQVRDKNSTEWHAGGVWSRSIPSFCSWDPVTKMAPIECEGSNPSYSDLGIILTPLSRVRHAETVVVELPRDAPSTSALKHFMLDLTSYGIQKRSFGLNRDIEAEWNDDDTLAFEDAIHVWLDYLLDGMDGQTAAILRRDRLKLWCSEYEHEMGRHFHGFEPDFIGGASGFLDNEQLCHITKAFHDRFMSAREHVVEPYRDILRRHGQHVVLSSNKDFDFWCVSEQVKELGINPNLGKRDTFW